MDKIFFERGFTEIIKVNFNNELTNLQNLIYETTKNLLEDHDQSLSVEAKLKIPFKTAPSDEFWSKLMNTINSSKELKEVISSRSVSKCFETIFKQPVLFHVCPFRARLPDKKKFIYGWHQDEATWFLSRNEKIKNKFPPVLWLSINGANKTNSIQLVKFSHLRKVFHHKLVDGQGYFNIKNPENLVKEENIHTLEVLPSEGVIFHPVTIHRSVVPHSDAKLIPRYSVDIRYYDENFKPKIKVDLLLRFRKAINIFSGQKW
tara:strand:- start:2908 stop:3690 length:783 start_codon:yes stop_codon:yes gene_type:complete